MNRLLGELFGTAHPEEFVSGVFSDELDRLGLSEQVSAGWVQNNSRLRLFGRVRTLTLETIATADERIGKGLGFLSSLGRDEILLVKGSLQFAYFGELMARLSTEIGLSGVVIDGLTRDTYYTQGVSLPIFARGYSPRDIKGRGRVGEVDVPVAVDGIQVTPGDYVFGDSDALVFIPAAELPRLRAPVTAAVAEEAQIKRAIHEGTSVSELLRRHQAF